MEPRHPGILQIGGRVSGAGVMPIVVEIRHVVPPLRELAGVEVGLELRRGHDVGAARGVLAHGGEV